ncbi:hypothetical protein ACFYUV_01675 [Nonomuraea sp. NPDC003560]|uniref:hypothetical protein n=1 Tax=Nonomuraea sp. NPDC003560 TaxID=3364341 RepID=UPI003673E254
MGDRIAAWQRRRGREGHEGREGREGRSPSFDVAGRRARSAVDCDVPTSAHGIDRLERHRGIAARYGKPAVRLTKAAVIDRLTIL